MRHNQNRRSRGRNRKGPNPLTRSFRSNGPDVKVRGTAMHIAEKYMSLARDAHSFGDSVAAENYLQHAEHYNRIVMAAQAQLQQVQQVQYRDGPDDGDDEDRQMNGRFRDRFEYNGDGRYGEEGREERFEAGEDDEQPGFQPRQMRPERQDRPQQQRFEQRDRPRSRPERFDRGDRIDRPERPQAPEQRDRIEVANEGNSGGEEPEAVFPAARRGGRSPSPAPPPAAGRERAPDMSAEAGPEEPTRDGEAALVAFPDR